MLCTVCMDEMFPLEMLSEILCVSETKQRLQANVNEYLSLGLDYAIMLCSSGVWWTLSCGQARLPFSSMWTGVFQLD